MIHWNKLRKSGKHGFGGKNIQQNQLSTHNGNSQGCFIFQGDHERDLILKFFFYLFLVGVNDYFILSKRVLIFIFSVRILQRVQFLVNKAWKKEFQKITRLR